MDRIRRSLAVIVFVVACVVALGLPSPLAALVQLLGTTALIMGGTQHPLVDPTVRLPDVDGFASYGLAESGLADSHGRPAGYVEAALTKYIEPTGPSDEPHKVIAVWTPEEFWPVFGKLTFDASVRAGKDNFDRCVRAESCTAHVYPSDEPVPADGYAVFAYSQSARIASLAKAQLIAEYRAFEEPTAQRTVFIMIGSPTRGNGGMLQRLEGLRIPILDVTFDGASPTDSPVVDGDFLYPTIDIGRQYDGWNDAPVYVSNVLAYSNAVAGILYLHGDYFTGTPANPVAGQPYLYQGQVGDTNYYMIATKRLPILLPLASIGVPDPVLAVLDAPLRVLIEQGYERDIPPGVPVRARLIRVSNPVDDFVNLAVATVTGLDDGLSLAADDPSYRPFHTTPVKSTFGVGGAVLPETTDLVAPTPPVDTPVLEKHPDDGAGITALDAARSLGASKRTGVSAPGPTKADVDVLQGLQTESEPQKVVPDEPKSLKSLVTTDTQTDAKPDAGDSAGASAASQDAEDGKNVQDGKDGKAAPEETKRDRRSSIDRPARSGGSADIRRIGRDSGATAKPSDRGASAPREIGRKHRAAPDGGKGVGVKRHPSASSSDGNVTGN